MLILDDGGLQLPCHEGAAYLVHGVSDDAEVLLAAAPEAEGAWYQAVLDDASLRESYPFSCVMDLDQDGTEELFLSSTEKAFVGAEDQARLMALVDGAPAVLKEIGGAGGEVFKYDAADQSLFYYSRLSGEGHVTQMKLENTEGTIADLKRELDERDKSIIRLEAERNSLRA